MNAFPSKSLSDNPKPVLSHAEGSAIQNPKWLGIAVAVAFALCGAVANAEQPKKVPQIGYLSAIDKATESPRIEAIRRALRELGYIEGQNLVTHYRYADGNFARMAKLAEELVLLKVDLIVTTGGDPVIRTAKNATQTIPIVMVGGGSEPVGAGFVESLARPGGNITGLTNLSTELTGKRPLIRLKSVDLPAPFGPMMAWRSPIAIARFTPLMIEVRPKLLRTSLNCSAGLVKRTPSSAVRR